eukprot:280895-Pyramimonas_sp.AAC.1
MFLIRCHCLHCGGLIPQLVHAGWRIPHAPRTRGRQQPQSLDPLRGRSSRLGPAEQGRRMPVTAVMASRKASRGPKARGTLAHSAAARDQ